MKVQKILPILILLFSGTILIGAGHGFGFMIWVEFALIPEFIDYVMNGQTGFNDSLLIATIVFIFGQLFLILSFFKKNRAPRLYQFVGVVTLLIGFAVLTYPLDTSNQKLSFYSGIPLLICCFIFLSKQTFIQKKESA